VTIRDCLRLAVTSVVERTGIPRAHVEKDFWITEALRRMSAVADADADADAERFTLLFKGGTSLSKTYRLIERFSEDVDVLVVLPTGSKGEQDRLLRRLIDEAADGCGLPAISEPTGTTKAIKRAARLHFPTTANSAGTSKGLLIELGSRGGTMPHERLTIRSLVTEHAESDIADVEEAEPFQVSVLSPARTLVEKLVLLHTAHEAADEKRIDATVRHYYDVYQLLNRPEILAEVSLLGVDALARDVVVTYSTAADLPASARPSGGFATSPAFTAASPSAQRVAPRYERLLGQLLWPGAAQPSFEQCLNTVGISATLL
jgi:predicted nucleotidyltransferase component of viral defense system